MTAVQCSPSRLSRIESADSSSNRDRTANSVSGATTRSISTTRPKPRYDRPMELPRPASWTRARHLPGTRAPLKETPRVHPRHASGRNVTVEARIHVPPDTRHHPNGLRTHTHLDRHTTARPPPHERKDR